MMKIIQARIAGIDAPVRGYIDDDEWPGLVIHRSIETPDRHWSITHRTSGRRVPGWFPTRNAAIHAAKHISPLVDWCQPIGFIKEKITHDDVLQAVFHGKGANDEETANQARYEAIP